MTFVWPKDVEGYLFEDEGRFLYETALRASPGPIVELGAYKGLSTICLAQGVRDRGRQRYPKGHPGRSHVWTVDHFQGEDPQDLGVVLYDDYAKGHYRKSLLANILRAGVRVHVTIVAQATDAPPPLPPAGPPWPIQVLFVDADHSEDAVLRDLRVWEPYCPDATIVFHDRGAVGPAKAIRKLQADGYVVEEEVGSIAVAKRLWTSGGTTK